MDSKIIILNGRGGVGKDTFVDLCNKYIKCIHISSITPIKEIAKSIGWDGAKTEKDRKFLSDLKFLVSEYNDLSFTYIQDKISEFYRDFPEDTLLFIDIREKAEIDKVHNMYNCYTCLIKNNRVPIINSNPADRDPELFTYDFVIDNNSDLSNLEECAKNFVLDLCCKG